MNKAKKFIWERFPFVRKVYSHYITNFYKHLYKKSPRLAAETYYANIHNGAKPDLDNPRTLDEKNIWLALNTDTTIWTRLSDKYAVRDYVRECGCENILNELYVKWDKVEDVDFSELPNEFVLKSNNASGTVIVVEDKKKADITAIKKTMKKWLPKKASYGYIGYNGHYLNIKPCLLAEKLLHDSLSVGLPIDYKFFCSYGEPFLVEVMQGRQVGSHNRRSTYYDKDWNLIFDRNVVGAGVILDKPKSYDQMIEYCYILAKQFPFVRVDFYEIDGQPLFGELTFTPSLDYFTEDMRIRYGDGIDLSKVRGVGDD